MMMIWNTLANFPTPALMTFIAGGLALNFAPGQDVYFASTCGIARGPRAGALAGLGVGLGVLMHLFMATVGLGAVVAAHPALLQAIKYAGAGYLLYLAWKSWTAGPVRATATSPRTGREGWRILRRGFLSNATNPKTVLFLLAFLPQFTRPEYGPVWQQILGLGLIFALTGTIVTMGYGVVAGYIGQAISHRLDALNKITALFFSALALRLVVT